MKLAGRINEICDVGLTYSAAGTSSQGEVTLHRNTVMLNVALLQIPVGIARDTLI